MSQANLDYNSSTNLQALPPFPRSQLPKSQINQWKKLLSAKRAELSSFYMPHTHISVLCTSINFFFIDFFLTCMMDFAKKKGLLVVLSSTYQNNYDDFY